MQLSAGKQAPGAHARPSRKQLSVRAVAEPPTKPSVSSAVGEFKYCPKVGRSSGSDCVCGGGPALPLPLACGSPSRLCPNAHSALVFRRARLS